MKIWIDADACPKAVKEVTFKFSSRFKVDVCLVANSYMSIPHSPHISLIQVSSGDDVADNYIADHVCQGDLVITADIPLAAKIVETGVVAINPRGEIYDQDNISERLSIRDFMQELRDGGVETSGPSPFGAKDKERFTNSLHRLLSKMERSSM